VYVDAESGAKMVSSIWVVVVSDPQLTTCITASKPKKSRPYSRDPRNKQGSLAKELRSKSEGNLVLKKCSAKVSFAMQKGADIAAKL